MVQRCAGYLAWLYGFKLADGKKENVVHYHSIYNTYLYSLLSLVNHSIHTPLPHAINRAILLQHCSMMSTSDLQLHIAPTTCCS